MNNIRKLREKRKWSQEALSQRINDVLEANPALKKTTKKNSDGLTDQKTVQRIETGIIKLNSRWLEILSKAFNCRPVNIDPSLLGHNEKETALESLERIAKEFENDEIILMNLEILKTLVKKKKEEE